MNNIPKLTAKNFFGHLRTVENHRSKVCRHCFRAGLYWQGLTHDLSKYAPEEFFISAAMYQEGKRSPNEAERENYGYSRAWMHHKGHNKHHFEYWCDYDPATKKMKPVKMPLIYVCEMFCDRVAASKVYMGDSYTDRAPLEYFLRGKPRRDNIHPVTSRLIEKLLTMLAEEGEEKTFRYIRKLLLQSRKRSK
ncbi:MAG: catalase [Oscillospiraceae bacterium]|nr:catalase [Oscillospiraceae bacterium]MBQ9208704.1 catalase [Oscillospiraceae bacterium]